ncbi:hypothetical protein [Bordetella tumulicola]|uniref:hypothetical protein n=1 Tax=Bordetella tumulicola TaxID=1649133 RepID=UPI0039EEC0ED
MSDSFFDDSDFFFLCRGIGERLEAFVTRFTLRPNSHSEVLTPLTERHVPQNGQPGWLWHLDAVEHAGVDLYLLDPSDRHFMICLRPDTHVVFGLPYNLLSEEDMSALLRQFDAICGWGWSNEPPPQLLADIKERARNPSPIYRRYCHGSMMQAGD